MAAKPQVLVIEDEPSVAENITYALSTEGFEPTWCATGEEGMAALQAGDIDLIILDVGLPDCSGFDLCRKIRALSDVPVIFLTARAEEVDRVVGLEIGADDYVVKPFSPRELTARARAILRRRGPSVANDGPSGVPFEIDDERQVVSFRGQRMDLTRYEYRLLALLVRHPGRVYSREVLMDQVWEEPDASMDRTVDAHIKSLRAKLREVDAEVDPIVTRRGLGYALREDW
jgi:two-component system catabolic regulation response regulator CreB